jgi:hypothetical protein
MPSAELRDHRIPCVRRELQGLRGKPVQLAPKDPDPYPNFYIEPLSDDALTVIFRKGSNKDGVSVDLRKIAEITATGEGAYIRLLGRVVWHADTSSWEFSPTGAVGRPAKHAGGAI